jgi:hypothetical protein
MTIGSVAGPWWWALIFVVLAAAGLVWFLSKLVDGGWWVLDRWRDRHDVDDLDEDGAASELVELAPESHYETYTLPRVPRGEGESRRQGPAPAADPGWQVTDTGTLFPPLWLEDRRPDLVDAIPALGREWRR